MKKLSFLLLLFIIYTSASAQDIDVLLSDLSKKHNFTYREIKTDTFFIKKFELLFIQPIDHKNLERGSFEQRVFLSHLSFESPTLIITEGYAAGYANNPRYLNELAGLLKTNQVCVEHRYFGTSVPEIIEWDCLNTFNAATDHHQIVTILKNLYHKKWINTGISKGGQTAMYHRYYYPNDVDITVGYVCPLNFSIEDKRVYRFLNEVSDSTSRNKIHDYQYEMLKNKSKYVKTFENLSNKRNLTYPVSMMEAYELTVLEYSFAFWQWGNVSVSFIPSPPSSSKSMVNHLDKVAGIDWISNEGIKRLQPFFYQALTEIGFYGYNISNFKEVSSFTKNPTFEFTAPAGTTIVYDPEPMQQVDHFIRHEARNMMFIYGENDPWSATSVDLTYDNNLIKVVKPGGSHLTRINNLPEKQFNQVMQTLLDWLNQ